MKQNKQLNSIKTMKNLTHEEAVASGLNGSFPKMTCKEDFHFWEERGQGTFVKISQSGPKFTPAHGPFKNTRHAKQFAHKVWRAQQA